MHNVHRTSATEPPTNRVDPGSCGVRLGSKLRLAAEREARRRGFCLSVWIRHLVETAVQRADGRAGQTPKETPSVSEAREVSHRSGELDSAYLKEMEKLNGN